MRVCRAAKQRGQLCTRERIGGTALDSPELGAFPCLLDIWVTVVTKHLLGALPLGRTLETHRRLRPGRPFL